MKLPIRSTIILFILFFLTHLSFGQTYGNEWINYTQKYYAFPVSSTGFKRINYSDLEAAGIPLQTFHHDQIQVFGREKEIPIWVETNGDNSFDAGDYILLYAQHNDGWLDSTLYVDPTKASNPLFSFFTETIHYYFTWSTGTNNLRFASETADDYQNYTPKDFLWYKHEQGYTSGYLEGERLLSQLSSSFYVAGEGYGLAPINGVGTHNMDITIPTPFPYTAGNAPNARFKARVTTASSDQQAVNAGQPNQHTRFTINGQIVYDELGTGYFQYQADVAVPMNGIGSTTDMDWTIVGDLPVATMYQSLSYYSFEYPRLPNFGGNYQFKARVENGAQQKNRLDFTGLSGGNPLIVTMGANPRRLFPVTNAGISTVLFPNNTTASSTQLLASDFSQVQTITSFQAINGTGSFTNFGALSMENAYIIIYHPSLKESSEEYRDYRQSLAGGANNVVFANIDELYHQFSAGVRHHPNSVRRFAHRCFDYASEKPIGLFLIGKAINHGQLRYLNAYNEDLIPTFGSPATDVLLTANLPGTTKWQPLVPTGRLSVNTHEGVRNYLQKMMDYEGHQLQSSVYSSEEKDWQKHVVHLVGGITLAEQTNFNVQMNLMRNKITTDKFGGTVHTLKRESDDPIPPGELQTIMSRISDGVSLMTYYGHRGIGASGFEINLDDVSNWNNQGKYPLMLVNSCYNGDIYQQGLLSSSEYFVNAQNLGAIGYISSSSVGFHPMVGIYSNNLYEQFSKLTYRGSIGQNMKQAIAAMEIPTNLFLEVTATQNVLNGDPVLKLNSHNKPEIELLEQNVSFSPSYVDLNTDSIAIQVLIKNLGQSVVDTFTVEIRRNFPGTSTDSIYTIRRPRLDYADTVRLMMPLQPGIAAGMNLFDIRVDIPSFVAEQYDEVNNNQLVKQYQLNLDGILPVVPYEFAVIPTDTITLKASTINPLASLNTYRFQIDTTDLFNSPFLKNALVVGTGGVKEVKPNDWDTPLQFVDSMVYFWRVAVEGDNPNWSESSFQYIQGRSGWGQDHFFQFKKGHFANIHYNRNQRIREWLGDSIPLTATAYPDINEENAWNVNGVLQDYGACSWNPALHVGVFDPVTWEAWGTNYNGLNPDHDFGNYLCRNRVERHFVFWQDNATSLQAFQNMVLNEVPDGHYMVIYSPVEASYSNWNLLDSINMYQTFQTLGFDSIIPGRPNAPFALFVRKGYPNTAVQNFIDPTTGAGSENNYSSVSVTGYVHTSISDGAETSTLIGPSTKWGNVYWKQNSIDPFNNHDTTRLILQPYDWNLVAGPVINLAFSTHDSLMDLNTQINAQQYPFLRLRAVYKDSVNFTPAQVDSWHVLYDQVPEAAIDGTNGYYFSHATNDSIYQGEELKFAVDVKNIFTVPMDSLLINYWVEDNNNVRHPITYARQDSLRVGATLRDTITFSTNGFPGYNTLWMEVNPYLNGSLQIKDQPEQFHFNNVLQLPFKVETDRINPLLDVTFDGRHILNGDIVSATSEILISLKDENPYLVMDADRDTTLFGIYLTDPTGTMKRIPFVDQNGITVMQWITAESNHKKFKIMYPGAFKMDGKYRLLVQGTDRSGNLSGDLQYKIDFEVVQSASITHMMNYPNPFSTSTKFVFTITGSEVPDDIIIQIMTVSGRVVREITEDELGKLYVGRNITEYAWDGRDEFGDQLANGVYLYTVKTRIRGESIEHRESGADQYFKKNFGKMYLMR